MTKGRGDKVMLGHMGVNICFPWHKKLITVVNRGGYY